MTFIEKKLFSVIIPLYNKEKYVAATLNSVLSQSHKGFEVIIVNDGSTDNSLEVVKSFSDSRIKVYSKVNGGVSEARNTGIELATTEYVAYLDADDLWEPTYLEEMKELIEKFPGCGMYASAHRVVEKNRAYDQGCFMPEGVICDYFQIELLKQITRLSATVVPTAISKEVGGFPVGMVSGEDSYFCAKVAISYKVAFTPGVLVTYNKRSSGIALRYGKVDKCKESWFDLLDASDFYRNEFVADKAIKAGIRYALGSHKQRSFDIEKLTKFNKYSRRRWKVLFLLNRFPSAGVRFYKDMKPLLKAIKSIL